MSNLREAKVWAYWGCVFSPGGFLLVVIHWLKQGSEGRLNFSRWPPRLWKDFLLLKNTSAQYLPLRRCVGMVSPENFWDDIEYV